AGLSAAGPRAGRAPARAGRDPGREHARRDRAGRARARRAAAASPRAARGGLRQPRAGGLGGSARRPRAARRARARPAARTHRGAPRAAHPRLSALHPGGTMDIGYGSLANLARLRDFERRRLSSYDRRGGNRDFVLIPPGERVELGRIEGAGCVKHVWVTTMPIREEPHDLCGLVLRAWWDGEASPSVEVPLGDFFGVGFGLRRNFASLPLQMSPHDGRGMNCWFPMPFADGARFEVENQGSVLRVFYFYVDYE